MPDCLRADDETICTNVKITTDNHATKGNNILHCKSGNQVYDETSICHYDTVDGKMAHCEDGTHLGTFGTCTDFTCWQSYKCKESYCIPIRKICDGRSDCPSQEDEKDCDDYTCPGHLKCTGQSFCVPRWELCDGIWHCPYGDDEKYCQICPDGCSCIGSVVSCRNVGNVSHATVQQSPAALILRNSSAVYKILVSGTNIIFDRMCSLQLLGGQISDIMKPFIDRFPVLQILHLVKLHIKKITPKFIDGLRIKLLNLSYNNIYLIENGAFDAIVNVKVLSFISNAITHLEWHFCHRLKSIQYLFITDNPLTDIAPNLFLSNPNLRHIESD